MVLSPRLSQKLTTSLVMTPQLQQAIRLLQMSNQELAEYIAGEIEQNPLLERESPDGGMEDGPADPDGATGREGIDPGESGTLDGLGRDRRAESGGEGPALPDTAEAAGAVLDTDFDNVWTNDDRGAEEAPILPASDWGSGGFDAQGLDPESRMERPESLRDHLMAQINLVFSGAADRLIATVLVDALDEAGYLTAPLAEIADRLGIDPARLESILLRAQECDPPGVFARSLAECLALQLKDRNRLDPAMAALLDHLDLLAERNLPALCRLCGIDREDLALMIQEIQALDPKPGLRFGETAAHAVIPDILLSRNRDGGWRIELNPDTLPRVLINRQYLTMLDRAPADRQARRYITERLQAANWLTQALHQRAETILKVATAIVETQEGFFRDGISGMKPLILKEIADLIGMHESTVSRVTSNKYIATPRGMFELKYFFTQALASRHGGEAHSAMAVRHRIRELIDGETPETVLSDDRLVAILESEGIEIARRTVAKYRESMRIPSSIQRRRQKAPGF